MIKTLYANGDSWTFGQELRDYANDHLTYKFYNTWPWHLAQRLDIPQVVNDALGGTSNYRIFRKTIDYIRNYKGNYNHLLVIVAWTTYERVELPVVVKKQHNNGYSEWETLETEYTSMLMNSKPNVKTKDSMTDKLIQDWHMNRTLLNHSKINSYEFFNLQWLLKQTCNSLGVNLLQMYALDNPEFVANTPEANTKWMDAISPYPESFNKMLMRVEGRQDVRAPGRHPNEQGHQKIADRIYIDALKRYTNWSIKCPY